MSQRRASSIVLPLLLVACSLEVPVNGDSAAKPAPDGALPSGDGPPSPPPPDGAGPRADAPTSGPPLAIAGHARFVSLGQGSVVLDGSRSRLPLGCTVSWTADSANPGPSTVVGDSTLTPQVTPSKAGAHRFRLTLTCAARSATAQTSTAETVVHVFAKPLPRWPDKIFYYSEDGVAGDNATTGAAGRQFVFDPAQHPKVVGQVTEVWIDVAGQRLKMQQAGGGTFSAWVTGAAADADRRYSVFVDVNRFAVAPVPLVKVSAGTAGTAGAGSFAIDASLPLAASFQGATASYVLLPDPMNPGQPSISAEGSSRFVVQGPLAAPHLFYLVAETGAHRSLPTLITLPPPPKPPARPDLGVIYEVFVKHFADSNGDGIGDLNGLRSKLDYLATDLGVNTLLLMPIFATPGTVGWGYAPADFATVHPQYGTTQDLSLLVKEAHAKGLHVLLDVPVNHVHKTYAACAQAVGNPASPTSSWFFFFDDNQQWFGWDYKDDGPQVHFFAPRKSGDVAFNLDDPDARAEMLRRVRQLLDPDGDGSPADGIDGLRLDYVKGPSLDFWRALADMAQGVNSNVALFGEAWTGAKELGAYLREAGLNGVFDFPFHYALRDGLKKHKADALYWHLSEANQYYTGQGVPLSFTSNHDVGRIVSDLQGESFGIALAAASLVLTAPGNPMLFFGDELGLLARVDPSAERKNGGAFVWGAGDKAQTADPAGAPLSKPPSLAAQRADPNSLFSHHQALLALRKQHAPLKDGVALGYHYGEINDPALYAMVRQSGQARVLVVVNLGPGYRTVSFSELGKSTLVYSQGLGSGNTVGPYGTQIYELP